MDAAIARAGGDPGGPAARMTARPGRPAVPHAVVGTLVFLAAEAMFFASLVSAMLVLRAGVDMWPPPGQPRLPQGLTAFNTCVLLASGGTMAVALSRGRRGLEGRLDWWLGATGFLGALFLVIQGSEWVRMLGHGLYASSGLFGATFYTLIGCHGVHVLGGLAAVLVVWRLARRGRYGPGNHAAVDGCALYWFFVVAVWPVLWALVYR